MAAVEETTPSQTFFNLQRDLFEKYKDHNSVFARNKNSQRGLSRQTSNNDLDSLNENYSPAASVNIIMPPTVSDVPPTPPAPPPPPPLLNGGLLPTRRLQSDISERCEAPSKLQNTMNKNKKPFTYTPGGIDLSQIKSPRMQRRIIRNVETPGDIDLPATSSTPHHPNPVHPSVTAAVTPQMGITVFPRDNVILKEITIPSSTTPLTPSNSSILHPNQLRRPQSPIQGMQVVINGQSNLAPSKTSINVPRAQVGTLYIPPISSEKTNQMKNLNVNFPKLRESPTPWLQKPLQQSRENLAPWVRSNSKNINSEKSPETDKRKAQTVLKVSPEQTQIINNSAPLATHVIPIRFERSEQPQIISQRWSDKNKHSLNFANNFDHEPGPKPIQSRSFKVIQKITDSDDDTTDFHSNSSAYSENVPLNYQIKISDFDNDNHVVTNRAETQVIGATNENHIIPNRSDYRHQSVMMNSKQPSINQSHRSTTEERTISLLNTEPKNSSKIYIPPSERQAEEETRKYMGSSIPSRSFRMLQAMTANQDSVGHPGISDF